MIKEIRKKLFWVSGDWGHYNDEFMDPYRKWLEENCNGHYVIDEKWTRDKTQFFGFAVYIENDEDAIAFKLRWLE